MAGTAAALVLAGCSGGANDSASTGAAAPQRDAAQAPQQGGGAAPAQYLQESRAIVYTGSITVQVANVDQAATQATAIATAAGGFIGADKRSRDSGRPTAILELRVPSGKFGGAVDELARLGRQEARNVDTDDVTQESIDLDAKITSQRASVGRTRALFAQAKTISEIVSVEGELSKREAELATLEARKRKLDDLTALSTITATLLGPSPTAAVPKKDDDDKAGFLDGLRTGWNGFLGALSVVLAILGFLLPFAAVLGIPALLAWRILRRRRRPAPTTPPAS
jgi:hypothetical protein